MSLTLSEVQALLSSEVPANRTFLSELNIVRSRLIQSGSWKGVKRQINLQVFSDYEGNSIITLPRWGRTILAGAMQSDNVVCSGDPMGVRNEFSEFDLNGRGYGFTGRSFQQVPGRWATFQDWVTPMYLRFKFEVSESVGTIHIRGNYSGDTVMSLYGGTTWISGEKVDFSATTTVTSTKLFDAQGLSIIKPATLGRVSMYAVDGSGNETLVAKFDPDETVPRRKRYKVPTCADVTPLGSSCTASTVQTYTKSEVDSYFADRGVVTVSAAGSTSLSYSSFFMSAVKIIAQAGSGSYTYNFTLGNPGKSMAVFVVNLEVAASANPVLVFKDVAGTTLLTVNGDSDNITYQTLRFEWRSGAWHLES